MIQRFILPFALSIVMVGCAEMNMDLTTAIKVQEAIISDNADANEATKCIVDFDKKLGTFNGEFRDTIVVEVDQDCIQEIAKEKLDDSEE